MAGFSPGVRFLPAGAAAPRGQTSTAPAAPRRGYLHGLPAFLILGSFLVITMPLCWLVLSNEDFLDEYRWPVFVYVWLLGSTHFVITLTVYLQSANLRYFNSSWKNRALYFLIPIVLLLGFDFYQFFNVPGALPLAGFLIALGIRFLDFFHFSRQSYGVLQLFQWQGKQAFPSWLAKLENYYFLGLTVLLLVTFLEGGRFAPDAWPVLSRWFAFGIIGFLGASLGLIGYGYFRAWRTCRDPGVLWIPAVYLLMQSVAGALAVYNTALYIFCLAVHYVEYHVVMYPRCFRSALDPSSRTDRWFALLRSRRVILYGLVVLAAGAYAARTWSQMGGMIARAESAGTSPLFVLVALFDGLFVLHYFLEMLIWKFSEPYYRQQLGPLYFA
jgi:hypothetical protein